MVKAINSHFIASTQLFSVSNRVGPVAFSEEVVNCVATHTREPGRLYHIPLYQIAFFSWEKPAWRYNLFLGVQCLNLGVQCVNETEKHRKKS